MQRGRICLLLLLVVAGLPASLALAADESVLDARKVSFDLTNVDLPDIVSALNRELRLPVCVESRLPASGCGAPPTFSVHVQDLSVRVALDQVTAAVGTYTWQASKEPFTVNLIPTELASDPDWTPNRRCPEFKLENASFGDAVQTVSSLVYPGGDENTRLYLLAGYSIGVPSGKRPEGHPLMKFLRKRITIVVKAGTVREAFSQIAAVIGDASWGYSERSGDKKMRTISFQPIVPLVWPADDDCNHALSASGGSELDLESKLTSGRVEKIAQANIQIVSERNQIIGSLRSIIQDPLMREKNIAAVVAAIEILGDIRAVEAVPDLLDMIDYSRFWGAKKEPHLPDRIVPWLQDTPDPDELGRHFPCVTALVKTRVAHELVIAKLRCEKDDTREKCFVGVLIGTEGRDVAEFIMQSAVGREKDTEAGKALRSALNWFKVYDDYKRLKKVPASASSGANQ